MGGSPKTNQNLADYSVPAVPQSPLAKKMESYLKQHEGEQMEQYSTAFANKDAGTPNFFGRDASKPASQTEKSAKAIHEGLN
jgi:hypothetical protein